MKDQKGRKSARDWILIVLGILIALAGLALGAGGAYLVSLGGSWYFLLMGIAMIASGLLIAARRPSGAWLYGAALIVSIMWALWDAGFEYWPLVSRLFALGVIALLVALAYPALSRASGGRGGRVGYAVAGLVAIVLVVTAGSAFTPKPEVAASESPSVTPVADGEQQEEWRHYGNTTAGTRFSALDQITRDNVDQLEVAWTFRTGDIAESDGFGAEDQNTPLQIGDTLYICTPYNKIFALDADSGEQRWEYDPEASAPGWQRCRGLGYYEVPEQAAAPESSDDSAPADAAGTGDAGNDSVAAAQASDNSCRRRLYLNTIDARLISIDAETGEPCASFGDNGTLDLKHRMGDVEPGYYTLTSSPLIAGDLVVVGGRVADNVSVNMPPGVIRAFDAVTGELVWAWDPGNPSTDDVPPEGETYTRGTPNVWATMSYDPELNLIYLPTGNTTPDMWGGQRTELNDRYSSSIVALEADTGEERWSYQTVHHDLWDYDVPSQPLLYDVPDGDGGTIPALLQTTKQGQIFLLNRETGESITEVVERPVAQGDAEGERYSETQPFSIGMPSIGTETLTEADMWGATPFDQLLCRIQFKKMRYDGAFTPPGTDMSLQWPGSLGGMNWGGVSVDPTTDYVFVNDMRLGLWTRFIPREEVEEDGEGKGVEMGLSSQLGTPYLSERNRFLSPLGIPCQEPPFGTMTAIDLNTNEIAWQVPIGTVEDTGPLGIKMQLPIPIGMPTVGGTLATQSGLLFFAGTQDYYLRAYDSGTGELVWKQRLPVGSQGSPISYVSPDTGKQYIVVTAGGARQSPDRGDYVIAYKLPDDTQE